MTKDTLKIVFMGTPDFAVESLKYLVENNYNIVGVVTMPDKPAGRGHKLQFSPVKEYALAQKLNLLQPDNLKDSDFLSHLKALNADLQIVVAFRMLPQTVWAMPPMGTFNLHGSLLPQYRGAAPINWAIMNGEKETGVTTFFLKHEIDTGEILLQEKIEITENDNVGRIYSELMVVGAKLVLKTVDMIIDNKVQSIPQHNLISEGIQLHAAPKIFKETCKINWTQSVGQIHNHIRGLSPSPVAWTLYEVEDDKPITIKIYETEIIEAEHNEINGAIVTDNKKFLHIACKGGFVNVLALQLPGKKVMPIKDVLNGFKFEVNKVFI